MNWSDIKRLFIVPANPPRSELAMRQKPETEVQKVRKVEIERITLLRNAPDIGGWRAGLMMAESTTRPDRRLLYQVYKEIVLDPHLQSVMQRIILRCTNNPIHFYLDGKRQDGDIDLITKMPWFMDMVKYILESKWWGHSLVQCNFLESNYNVYRRPGVELISRPNVRPEYGDILPRAGDESNAILYRKPPWTNFLLEVGDTQDLGLLNVVAAPILYKRYGVKDWAEFLEVYGMPIREIQYDPNVPGARQEAITSMEEQGSNAGVATPVGSMFKLHDGNKMGNSEAFNLNATFHNKEISKVFLLQTMTTEEGSSLSQSETHQKAEDEAIMGYRLFVEMVLNYKMRPILEAHGYTWPEGGAFKYDDRPRISKVAMADLLVKLQSIADIPMSWVYDTFGIPAPTGSEDIKDNPAARSQQPDLQTPAEKKKLTLPEYSAPAYMQLSLQEGAVTAQEESLLRDIYLEQLRTGQVHRGYFNALVNQLADAISTGVGTPTEDWNAPDHLYQSLLEANVQRFSAAKTLALNQQLNEIKDGARSFSEFKTQAAPLLQDYNVNWMRAEYNHAVAAAQNGANFIRQRANAELYPYWEYQTVGDDRVRITHQALDGKIFRIDDVEAARVYPPNGWGCRCEGVPRATSGGKEVSTLENAISALGEDWDTMTEKGYAINYGDAGQVFSRTQEYLASWNPNALTWRSFGLKAYHTITGLSKAKEAKVDAGKWIAARRGANSLPAEDAVRLVDHRRRPILLEDNTAEQLASRGQSWLLGYLEEALSSPDEAWLQFGASFLERKVLKFFQGQAMVVSIAMGSNTPEAITAISLATEPGLVREGILTTSKR